MFSVKWLKVYLLSDMTFFHVVIMLLTMLSILRKKMTYTSATWLTHQFSLMNPTISHFVIWWLVSKQIHQKHNELISSFIKETVSDKKNLQIALEIKKIPFSHSMYNFFSKNHIISTEKQLFIGFHSLGTGHCFSL